VGALDEALDGYRQSLKYNRPDICARAAYQAATLIAATAIAILSSTPSQAAVPARTQVEGENKDQGADSERSRQVATLLLTSLEYMRMAAALYEDPNCIEACNKAIVAYAAQVAALGGPVLLSDRMQHDGEGQREAKGYGAARKKVVGSLLPPRHARNDRVPAASPSGTDRLPAASPGGTDRVPTASPGGKPPSADVLRMVEEMWHALARNHAEFATGVKVRDGLRARMLRIASSIIELDPRGRSRRPAARPSTCHHVTNSFVVCFGAAGCDRI
jgi:hypothetical protein